MSRGRSLPVTMSAAKRTFATQKARASWALKRGPKQDESDPVNSGRFTALCASVMDSGRECQPDGWL